MDDYLGKIAIGRALEAAQKPLRARVKLAIFDILDGRSIEEGLALNGVKPKSFWLLIARDRKMRDYFDTAMRSRFTESAFRLTEIAKDFRNGKLTAPDAIIETRILSTLTPVIKAYIDRESEKNEAADGWESLDADQRTNLFGPPITFDEPEPLAAPATQTQPQSPEPALASHLPTGPISPQITPSRAPLLPPSDS